jgi:hypothetical protein
MLRRVEGGDDGQVQIGCAECDEALPHPSGSSMNGDAKWHEE